MTAPSPKEALEECIAVLHLVEQPAIRDPDHGEEVGALGDRIGFGALMSAASAEWRERLVEEGVPTGGEFVAGPCRVTVLETLAKARSTLATLSRPAGERREAIARVIEARAAVYDDCQATYRGPTVARELRNILAALASGLVQDEAGWRDISSAPKDGEIIYINKFGEIGFCYWSEALHSDQESIWWDEQKCDECVPRYWLPRTCLPAPPIRSDRDGGEG